MLAAIFVSGLLTAGVVSGAGPLAVLATATDAPTTDSTSTDTTDSTTTESTTSDSTTTESTTTETEPPGTTSTETTTTTEAHQGGPCARTASEALSTDAPDYAPGSIVQIFGTGFALDCDVELRITRPDSVVETLDVTSDGAGELSREYALPPPPGVIGTYRIDAYGADGVLLASMEFGDSRIVQAVALDGQPSLTVLPGASIPVQARVRHEAAGGTDNDWRSTRWTIGTSTACVNHVDFANTGTDTASFNAMAPAPVATHDITIVAFINDNCTGTEGSDISLTLTGGVVVDDTILFTDRFGTSTSDDTVDGWADGDVGGDDCAIRAITPVAGQTAGFNNGYLRLRSGCMVTRTGISTVGKQNINLKYMHGQDTDNDGSDDGDLVAQWKKTSDAAWVPVNTHDLANNTATDPTAGVNFSLPASAANTSIDIRFSGNTPEDNDRARVDNVIVTGTPIPANTPPVAVDDTYSANEDSNLVLDATTVGPNASPVDNDTDADGHTLTVTAVGSASGGGVILVAGVITFMPTPNLCGAGAGAFDYTVSDGNGGTDTGHVTVNLTCVDDPPTAVNDSPTVGEDSGANVIDVLANDTDIDAGPKTVTSVTQPANGTVTNNGANVTYQPNANYCNNGAPTDDFTYTVNGGSSATVSVTVTCVDDAPVVAFTGGAASRNEGQSDTYTFSISDPDSSSFTYEAGYPTCGLVGSLQGTPALGTSGSFVCSFTDGPASPTLAVVVRDATSPSNEATRPVTVHNLPPTIGNVSVDSPIDEGESSTVTVSATDPGGSNDPLSYEFDCDGNGTYEVGPQSSDSHACSYIDDGSVTVNVRVTDGDGGSDTDSETVVVENLDPTITNVTATSPIDEGDSSLLTVTASDPAGVNDPLAYEFDCDGNGMYEVGPLSSDSHACSYPDDGNFTVGVRVTDGDGGEDTDTAPVQVDNVPPTIAISGAASVNEGSSYTLSLGAVTDPGDDTVSSYVVHWGDGDTDAYSSGGDVTHNYADGPNTHAVTVDLVDEDDTHTDVANDHSVQVDNVPPTIAISGAASVNEGSSYTLSLGAVTDPGDDTVSSYVVHWGDGDTDAYSSGGDVTHNYADGPNTHAVTVDLVDEDDTHTDVANDHSVQVDNVPPTIAISGAASVNEGSSYTLSLGAVTDPGDDTVSSYVVHWGDGDTDAYSSGGDVTHNYADGPNTHAVTVDLVDEDDTHTDVANDHSVQVDNVPPTITNVSADTPIQEGGSSTVTVTATDPAGANDPLEYQFDCDGSGTYEVGPQSSNSHACSYPDDGNFTVGVRVTDGDGGADTDSTSVVVENVPPTITNVSADTPIQEGGSSTVTVTATDPAGANDPLEYQFDCDGSGTYEVGPQSSNSHACSYPDDGNFTVGVRVTDGDGGADTDSTSVVVENVPPTKPGKPTTSDPNPNGTGGFTLTWTASTDVPADTVTYLLEHKDADDAGYTTVSSGFGSNSYAFGGSNPVEDEGTWTYRVTASDEDGGVSDVSDVSDPIKVDKSNPNTPSAAADRAADYAGAGGWYQDTVTVSFTHNGDPDLADGSSGSGVNPSSVTAPETYNTSGPHTKTGTVKDFAGNESSSASLTVQVDTNNPTFGACVGGPFLLGSGIHTVSITAADAGESGINAAASTLTGTVDASSIGPKNLTFTAVDNVGHSSTKTCTYSVIFNFHGFFNPVDNGVYNTVNSGQAIPVKFDLSGNQGLNIFMTGFPASAKVACTTGTGSDPIEETVTAGNSSLKYSEGTPYGQYHYVWKTDKAWANTCRRLDLKFVDGTTHSALFKFSK